MIAGKADETFHGGKPRAYDNRDRKAAALRKYQTKAQVFAMVERQGRVRAFVVPDRSRSTLQDKIREHVLPASMIFTDEWQPYEGIGQHFKGHRRIRHKANVYVDGDVHTNTPSRDSWPRQERNPGRPPRGQPAGC